jgi:hypothetical protein
MMSALLVLVGRYSPHTTLALIDGHFEPPNQQQLVQELYIIEGTQVMISVTHDHDVYFDARTRNVCKFLGNRFMVIRLLAQVELGDN